MLRSRPSLELPTFPGDFNRSSAPDANSGAGCRTVLPPGGGDMVRT